jgi:hypothetical protein
LSSRACHTAANAPHDNMGHPASTWDQAQCCITRLHATAVAPGLDDAGNKAKHVHAGCPQEKSKVPAKWCALRQRVLGGHPLVLGSHRLFMAQSSSVKSTGHGQEQSDKGKHSARQAKQQRQAQRKAASSLTACARCTTPPPPRSEGQRRSATAPSSSRAMWARPRPSRRVEMSEQALCS